MGRLVLDIGPLAFRPDINFWNFYSPIFMSQIDWLVLILTLFSIVGYGLWKSKSQKNLQSYFLADQQLPWYQIGLSVMATQASAITFLSAPGQAYTDGIRFVQFYFGLPLAMIVLCVAFVPRFRQLNVYTAYEYLENRFDRKTRLLTAFLFLLQRGLSTGITIYAPSLVLATLLGIQVNQTCLIIGILVIIYTVYGGTRAVSYTHMLQMGIIFFGLGLAGYLVVKKLPEEVGLFEALSIGGAMGKMKVLDTQFDLNNKYNLWSGLIGGFFLQLSYFGTDQSQVGRYLTAKSVSESRLGLIMNGLLKIPMQFLILMIGVLVFSFYQFNQAPLSFNSQNIQALKKSSGNAELETLQKNGHTIGLEKNKATLEFVKALEIGGEREEKAIKHLKALQSKELENQLAFKNLLTKNSPQADANDSNYIFLRFVMDHYPLGMVGLLMAVIFLASMGSTASGLNSLSSTTVVDFFQLFPQKSKISELLISRIFTLFWGIFCVVVAMFASKLGNLIEAVNILGSLFYGCILGIFLVAFFLPKIDGTSVFISAMVTEFLVCFVWKIDGMAFLWLNALGSIFLPIFAYLLWKVKKMSKKST